MNYECSNYAGIVSGVIQGSVLGPLLFLLYINDVTDDIFGSGCIGKLYADVIKLYSILDNSPGYCDLQGKLSDLQQWSDLWQLKISYKNIVCYT